MGEGHVAASCRWRIHASYAVLPRSVVCARTDAPCAATVELAPFAAIKGRTANAQAQGDENPVTHAARQCATILLVAVGVAAATSAAHDGKLTFAPVLERVTPAVVNIQVASSRSARHPLFNDPSFRRFFRGREMPQRGSGAGVIIDADEGYVVTNHHVIDDADEITVTLKDRREITAKLVGSDPQTDIALLQIEGEDLSELALGDSEQLAVGDFVIAIGNPYELGHTVTSGIVSALGRERGFLSDGGYEDFIQTDAAINRGNSGGALVDLDGRLVGINSAIVTPSGGSAGLGFAVPSNIVKVVTGQIIEHGEVQRGQLGVIIASLSADDAEALDLDAANGAVVSEVLDDTAAEAAGIEPGDVIVSLDGEAVQDARDLRLRIGLTQPGSEVDIGIVRDGKRKRLAATIGGTGGSSSAAAVGTMPMLSGAQWRNLSRGHELYGSVGGVEVTDVAPNSAAWNAGLRPGDVILRVNRRPVTDVDELEEALADARVAGLLIQRGQRRLFTLIR